MKFKKLIRKALKKLVYSSGILVFRDRLKYQTIDVFEYIGNIKQDITLQLLHYVESSTEESKLKDAIDGVLSGKIFYFNKNIDWDGGNFPGENIMSNSLDNSAYWSRCSLGVDKLGNDPKNIWELSRLEAIDVLILHYIKFEELGSLIKAIDLFSSWSKQNPFNRGVNWFSNMEVALRLNRLLLVAIYINGETRLVEYKPLISRLIEQHYNHLKLEIATTKNTMRGNHYLVELCSLTSIECLMGNSENVSILENEIFEQFNEDGSNKEGSTGYHIYTLEAVLWFVMFADVLNVSSKKVKDKAREAVKFISDLAMPNNIVPNIGDWDDGRVFKSKVGEPRNIAGMLGFASNLLSLNLHPIECDSLIFKPDFGISRYRYRHDNLDLSLFFRNGNVEYGHTHLDMLSICLADQFGDWICDGGTGEYNVSMTRRNEFRSVSYHSSISYKDESVLAPFRGFAWRGSLETLTKKISDNEIQGSYRTKNRDIIQRSVKIVDGKIIIKDNWAKGREAYNRLLISADLIEKGSDFLIFKRAGVTGAMKIEMISSGIVFSIQEKEISEEYGTYKACNELIFNSNSELDSSILQISFI